MILEDFGCQKGGTRVLENTDEWKRTLDRVQTIPQQ